MVATLCVTCLGLGIAVSATLSQSVDFCELEVRNAVHNPENDKRGTVRHVDRECNVGIMYDDNTTSKTIANGGISYVIPEWTVNKVN